MKKRRAVADITVDGKRGWTLPSFGSKKPFRHWAHVHFELDPTWGERTWTMIVDLEKAPDATAGHIEATVYFMASSAPEELLEEGAKFELLCGESRYANGVIRRVYAGEDTK